MYFNKNKNFKKFKFYTIDLNNILKNNLIKKNSYQRFYFYSLLEKNIFFFKKTINFYNNDFLLNLCKYYRNYKFGSKFYNVNHRQLIKILFKDMIHNYKTWRHIKGYPVRGQRTWSNGKSSTKNNVLLKNFRINQIIKHYGKKRKKKANLLVLGEYVNKLWLFTWRNEWLQARYHNLISAKKRGQKNTLKIDLKNLAMSITSGYKRKGKATKFNTAKNKLNINTIGLPLFFTKHIYSKVFNKFFPIDFSLQHEQRKMKSKKKIKKKIIQKKKNAKKKK